MNSNLLEGLREIGNYRTLIAVGLPFLGGALVVATSVFMPRGKAKGLITGAYLLLFAVGAACLFCGVLAAIAAEPQSVIVPLMLPGIVLTALGAVFSPAAICEYQQFEFRKLAAEIFRRS